MKASQLLLGVNIDHVATLRQARGTRYPDPVHAALQIEQAGADSITLHLREDRRHIQDRDVYLLRERMLTRMNLEMAVTEEMVKIACDVKPDDCCLVPEKREELTTGGGLDVIRFEDSITEACAKLAEQDIKSILTIPIFVAGKLWGMLGFDDCQYERNWQGVDIAVLKMLATIIAARAQRESIDFS